MFRETRSGKKAVLCNEAIRADYGRMCPCNRSPGVRSTVHKALSIKRGHSKKADTTGEYTDQETPHAPHYPTPLTAT